MERSKSTCENANGGSRSATKTPTTTDVLDGGRYLTMGPVNKLQELTKSPPHKGRDDHAEDEPTDQPPNQTTRQTTNQPDNQPPIEQSTDRPTGQRTMHNQPTSPNTHPNAPPITGITIDPRLPPHNPRDTKPTASDIIRSAYNAYNAATGDHSLLLHARSILAQNLATKELGNKLTPRERTALSRLWCAIEYGHRHDFLPLRPEGRDDHTEDEPTDQPSNQTTRQTTNQPDNQPLTKQSTDRPTGQHTNKPTEQQPTNQPTS